LIINVQCNKLFLPSAFFTASFFLRAFSCPRILREFKDSAPYSYSFAKARINSLIPLISGLSLGAFSSLNRRFFRRWLFAKRLFSSLFFCFQLQKTDHLFFRFGLFVFCSFIFFSSPFERAFLLLRRLFPVFRALSLQKTTKKPSVALSSFPAKRSVARPRE